LLRYQDDLEDIMELLPRRAGEAERLRRVVEHHLLNSLRITEHIMPSLSRTVDRCFSTLQSNLRTHVFVFNDEQINAYCYGGDDDSVCIAVTSALVNLLHPEELAFVIGHEIGHFAFGHERYPRPDDAQSDTERLNVLALQRNAEISADRVGLMACGDQEKAFRAILKSVSGVREDLLRFDFSGYLQQLRQLRTGRALPGALERSHPSFPVRLRALLWFSMSEPYQSMSKGTGSSMSKDELDSRVRKDLAALRGEVLSEMNDVAVKKAAFWGTLYCFATDARLTKAEQAYLQTFFPPELVRAGVSCLREAGPTTVLERFQADLRSIRLLTRPGRKQFVEELVEHSKVASGEPAARNQFLSNLKEQVLGRGR